MSTWYWKEESYDGHCMDVNWSTWTSGPYKIATCLADDSYKAFYTPDGVYVADPPDSFPCKGCGSAHCTGTHKGWRSLKAAQKACEEHAVLQFGRSLPW